MIQNYINHIALVVDKSGSMSSLSDNVITVFDAEISHLRQRSVDLNQETRISVYLFNGDVDCLVFDMDVMRMPSLRSYYRTSGQTALLDAYGKAVEDMKRLPELYGDHAFLVYGFTDGEENSSRKYSSGSFASLVKSLPEHWTVVCMVPNARGLAEAKKFGFAANNLQIWSTDVKGTQEMGKSFRSGMDNYMTLRSQGVRGTKAFFSTDLSGITERVVAHELNELVPTKFAIFPVRGTVAQKIKEFVESWTRKPYITGSTYYELTKTEHIQSYKEVCIQNKATGKVYAGAEARKLLALPAVETKVVPGDHGDWRIFIQSTSVNRNLIPGTLVLVRF